VALLVMFSSLAGIAGPTFFFESPELVTEIQNERK
jgi:hypothetical protein